MHPKTISLPKSISPATRAIVTSIELANFAKNQKAVAKFFKGVEKKDAAKNKKWAKIFSGKKVRK